ncbi:sulfotransferase [Nioella nitratireducens]|uniref:sulfotransferase n=1 Tax=Nioella nitratireducens TaxID=1287720 RepID=UPI0008FD24E4|nr:sulfotransferase [Nioella nitratireducens]
MGSDLVSDVLATELNEALSLLEDYRQEGGGAGSEPLPSLLEQCEALCQGIAPPEPIRSIHHLACTGGTLMSKCIAALPNVVLLSEIDPLSRMVNAKPGEQPRFAPTDLINALNHANRKIDDGVIRDAFRASVDSILTGLSRRGLRMVLRDHSHSQFCTEADAAARPTVHDMLTAAFPTLSLVSVRHPLDSFLSLQKAGWTHFKPVTLAEYSRRATDFLDRHDGCRIVRYEDFVSDPQGQLERMCDYLALPYEAFAIDLIGAIRITGDSGRSSPAIGPRPRRPVPEEIEAERRSAAYERLCARLEYDP